MLDSSATFVYLYWTVPSSSDSRPTVGFIGLGNMGAPVADRIVDAGYPLVVYNRTPEKAHACVARGAVAAESPQDVVRQADVFFTSLPNDRVLEDVATDVLPARAAGRHPRRPEHRLADGLGARRLARRRCLCRLPPRACQRQPDRRARRKPHASSSPARVMRSSDVEPACWASSGPPSTTSETARRPGSRSSRSTS